MARVLAVLAVLVIAIWLVLAAVRSPIASIIFLKAAEVEYYLRGEIVEDLEDNDIMVSYKVPDQLKDFAVPPGFQFVNGATTSIGGKQFLIANWKGTSTVDQVVTFYGSTMSGHGWAQVATFTMNDGGGLTYSKAPDQFLTITITSISGDTVIAVTLSQTPSQVTPEAQSTPTTLSASPPATSTTPAPTKSAPS